MAVKASEPGLPFRVHGLHPLQGQGGWTDPEPGGLCGAGCHDGGVQGDTQHHGRGQREFQVLDGDAQRPEEPWCAGRAVLLRGRPARLQGGNQCRIPTGADTALRHPHAAQLVQICELQRPEEVLVRLQDGVQCPEREGWPGCAGGHPGEVGGGDTPMPSATWRTTGKMSVPSSSSPMKSGA